MKIQLQGQTFELIIEKKNIKNVILHVLDGNVLSVSVPYSVSDKKVADFILSKQDWIIQTARRRNVQQEKVSGYVPNKNEVLFWGKRIPLVIEYGNTNSLLIKGNELNLKSKESDPQKIKIVFELEMKKVLMKKIEQLRFKYDQLMDDYRCTKPTITVRKMTSKWGSCIPNKAKITINLNLVYYPIECLEYVLLHEYVHMIVPNHSKRFYQIVENKMPCYRDIQRVLREA